MVELSERAHVVVMYLMDGNKVEEQVWIRRDEQENSSKQHHHTQMSVSL
jgi:hypothetical protein